MPDSVINFFDMDITILIISLWALIGRVLIIVLNKYKVTALPNLKLFLASQPYLIATIIILTYFITNDIGLITINLASLITKDGKIISTFNHSVEIIRFALVLWLLWEEEKALYDWLQQLVKSPKVNSILLKIRNSLKSSFFLLIFPLLLPEFIFFPELESVISKLIKLLLIWSIAWLITQLINAIEEVSLIKSEDLATTNYHSRSIITKAKICKRVLTLLITVIAVAASFMLFETTRTIGTSVLASAGVITGIVGLAANKTIGNFLTGLQIAFSEPIKINDAINVEGEFGIVEEISLSYAVIKIWDFRRLIVPINYFVDNHFINYSRNSTDVISSIIFCIDYTIPVAQLRKQFETIVTHSSFWDGKTVALQVTDIQATTLKLRGIASTKSPGDSWSLRCEVLEKLNNFMVNNYPNSLPKLRIIHEG